MIDIKIIQAIVREAAELFSNRKAVRQVREKGAYDYVTAVDEAVQKYIQEKLNELYPYIQFVGEEKENKAVDLNGIVYNPFSNEMYYAEKGNGSYLNGKRIHVGTATTMGKSLISIGTSPYYKEETEENFQMFSKIFKECQDIRRCGAASLDLAHVACGRIDGYMENHLKLWDYAAGTLLVREAGGEVFAYNGEKLEMEFDGNIVAGNRRIAECLIKHTAYSGYNSDTN